jgi:hypothetical protein
MHLNMVCQFKVTERRSEENEAPLRRQRSTSAVQGAFYSLTLLGDELQ